ncbi:MAG TPA: HD domain-containing phosphohydrolase [Blastocatellia bacterium]|nr:HD domain-containing phosphohydrolase [Blastocatellia bacterium]
MAKAKEDRLAIPEGEASSRFMNAVSAAGLSVFVCAVFMLFLGGPSLEWVLLSLVTTLVVSRTSVSIPKTDGTVTLDDTFIYISVLLYGVWPSVVLAGVNAILCSLRYSNRKRVATFNAGAMSLSVFASSSLITAVFGNPTELAPDLSRLILAAESLALVHYALNSMMMSTVAAFRSRRSIILTWRESFLWTWMSYFAGAVAACLIVKMLTVISFYAFIIAVPILGITFLTYRNYLEKVQTSIRHVEEVTDLHLRTIEALAIAIDAKDEVTHNHVHRVQIYATGLARLFGLSDPEIEALKAGALLHDIGKLAVPDYILNKPDKLTPAEFEKMKVHTIVGADILSRVGFPYPVVPIVRHHHERWDGRGYPDGLRGAQIPMTARILTVVDCFDAVREDRQYRKAMTREQAIELIRSGSGTMYDPEVVRVFLEHLPEFEAEIRRKKRDVRDGRAKSNDRRGRETNKKDDSRVVFEHIRNAHREVITLYEIAQTIGTSLDLRDMFAVFSSRLQDIVSYTTCVLYLQKPNSIDVEAVHVRGRDADHFKGAGIILGSGITGWVVTNRQPMYNCDPQLDFDAAQIKLDTEYRTVISVPLLKGEDALGALTLYSAELNAYEPDHLRLVEAVAKLAADAIANALHHEETEITALTDPVTGLANALALRLRFEQEAERARRYGDAFALLMMDLDCFKSINDSLGHKAGDEALKQVAGLLLKEIRAVDFLSRYAGDEFVALVQIGTVEVRELVQRLQQAIDTARFGANGSAASIGISVGWACFDADGETIDELLLAADRAMYADKLHRRAVPGASEDSGQLQLDPSPAA